jgi:ATP-dependent DNA helicase RecG
MRLSDLKGVGPTTLERLHELGIVHAMDLLFYAPRRYQVYELGLKQGLCTVEATIVSPPVTRMVKGRLQLLTMEALIEQRTIKCTIFGRNYMAKQLNVGDVKYFTGTFDNAMVVQEVHATFQPIRPLYTTGELRQSLLVQLIQQVKPLAASAKETLSVRHRSEYQLIDQATYLNWVHAPSSMEQVKQVLRRSKYEELLYYQLLAKYLRSLNQTTGVGLSFSAKAINQFLAALPFKMTNGQTQAVREILADLSAPTPMYRLLQGDVGSGKTAVAMVAMIATVDAGYQAALMVPTEVLAMQHFKSFLRLMNNKSIVLLTGTNKDKATYAAIASGKAQIIIGTHALFQEAVVYNKLGLVVADEQHRFGVNQRKAMLDKALSPNLLSMSATPIPRTLAISLFGDMEVSTIAELPADRLPIQTKVVALEDIKEVLAFCQQQINHKKQVFVVTSVIEASEQGLLDAKRTFDFFGQKLTAKVGLLHGNMVNEEKQRVMNAFANRSLDCLVATTVIEVGVDVPNATVMVILDAQRFGLSQLHQLRGRIGRGDAQSYCFLVHQSTTESANDRLQFLETQHDGFAIAEEDLATRGPGEFLGNAQSGFPQFRFSDLFEDVKILQVAAKDAADIVYNKDLPEYQMYWEYLIQHVGEQHDQNRD